jgi:sporulation protein YhbH
MSQPRAIFRQYQTQESLRSDRSAGDRARHRQKVRKAIRENVADIVAEQPIIGRAGDTIIKIPVRGIKEYRFIYGNAKGAGQGDGNTEQGQVVQKGKQKAEGKGGEGGDEEGVDYYETEIMLDELIEIMFEDLELPDMERRKMRETLSERTLKRAGVQRAGTPATLDKRKTLKTLIKRRVASGTINADEPSSVRRDDLRYRRRKPKIRHESNAAILFIMDTSGSMDTTKKYLARSFFFLLYQFVRARYRSVEVAFIAHHTKAKEVTEHEFFHKGESGGTRISAGYKKAQEIIAARYHPKIWNLYAFHGSDGDNFHDDNDEMLKCAQELADVCNLFGYAEIKTWRSGLIDVLEKNLKAENFKAVKIESKENVWPAFQSLLSKERIPRAIPEQGDADAD